MASWHPDSESVCLVRHAAPAALAGTWTVATNYESALERLAEGDEVFELPVAGLRGIATRYHAQPRRLR